MYNPSDVGRKGTLFGLPYSLDEADLVLVPVNLDATVSYGEGTSSAPKKILDESSQLDLSIPGVERPWNLKMVMDDALSVCEENKFYRMKAKEVIAHLERGEDFQGAPDLVNEVNIFCKQVHEKVESSSEELLAQNKFVGVVGGDHSSPLGLIRALGKRQSFGILQIDAHMDLRKAYEGFEYSHASIMHNALKVEGVQSLTQVGIRDYCEEEERYASMSQKSIYVFYDEPGFADQMRGRTWGDQVQDIIETLPSRVYISLDIDGLDPFHCPNTGTPVPGGLKFNEATYLLNEVVKSGRQIVGFDLCEVGDSAWDANVGARLLYRLCICLGLSQNLLGSK